MERKHLNSSLASAMFLMICATMIFYLPTAISRTALPSPEAPDGSVLRRQIRRDAAPPSISSGHDTAHVATVIAVATSEKGDHQTKPFTLGGPASLSERQKKSSLSLKTAAIIGSASVTVAVRALKEGR